MKWRKDSNMATETTLFDAAEYLGSPEAIESFLADAFATGDPGEIADALGIAARAHSRNDLAQPAPGHV
jgi:probable addiction module antidote protein